jgi:hypothetical protein
MTEGFGFPVLSAIVFVPIVAGVVMLFIDGQKRDMIRGIAITAAVIVLALSAAVYFSYNSQVQSVQMEMDAAASGALPATTMFERGLAFEEKVGRLAAHIGHQLSPRRGRFERPHGAVDRYGSSRRGVDLMAY